MKSLLVTAAVLFATVAGAQTITLEGVEYSTEPSVNSAPGHSIYFCTPENVAVGECTAVDPEYFEAQALMQFGAWKLLKMNGVSDVTGESREVLILQGGISTGIAIKLKEALAANPNITTLVLSSPGGNPEEARAIYTVVKEAGLNTWVPEGKSCMSACAEIFLAGKERIITGVVGFHSAWYNWTLGMPTDMDELIDFIVPEAQKHQAVFSAQHQAAGLSGEFNMDIAEAAGEFLVFVSSEELDVYTDANCFDCVDHTQFLRSVDEAQALDAGDGHLVESVTMVSIDTLAGTGM